MTTPLSDHGRAPKAPAKAGSAKWVVAALFLLSAIPLAAGAFRLTELAGGAAITPANARFVASPLPAAVFADPPTELSRALLMGTGWVMTLRVGA